MRKILQSKKGFSLIEVIVAMLIVAAISIAVFEAETVVSTSRSMARDYSMATNLAQKSLEEIRNAIGINNNFNILDQCVFPSDLAFAGQNLCNFDNIGNDPNLAAYHQSMQVQNVDGNPELRNVIMTVSWFDQNNADHSVSSSMLVSRPPEPLPGNIVGYVRDSSNNNILVGVNVHVDSTFDGTAMDVTSTIDQGQFNYDFSNNGPFTLTPGEWDVSATMAGFEDSGLMRRTVNSNLPAPCDFTMQALPAASKVTIRLVDLDNGNALITSEHQAPVIYLYQGGSEYQAPNYSYVIPWVREFNFALNDPPFHGTFWVDLAYRIGYGRRANCFGFTFVGLGWTTALAAGQCPAALTGYYGDIASDSNVTINPAQDSVIDIGLHLVPTITLSGRVVDDVGDGVAQAVVHARWPDGTSWNKMGEEQIATADENGDYEFEVPAVADILYPYSSWPDHSLIVYAAGYVPIGSCCDSEGRAFQMSNFYKIPNLKVANGPHTQDILIGSASGEGCGDLRGTILDGISTQPVAAALVTFDEADIIDNVTSDGSGRYNFVCDPNNPNTFPPCRLQARASNRKLEVSHTNAVSGDEDYYQFDNVGPENTGTYVYHAIPVVITRNSQIVQNVNLWPRGYGNVKITVRDDVTGNTVPSGVRVDMHFYDEAHLADLTAVTNASGVVTFNNVLETWPMRAAMYVGRPFLNTDPIAVREHKIVIPESAAFYGGEFIIGAGSTVPQNQGLYRGENNAFEVRLVPKSGI